ncbi:hypothetical protein HOP50_03g23490 [Chloropicon primus]|uniref:Uncharacterized protein n=1 Tax=Chloropicon primus TaxID=1764295 RepID=A0A5B8MHB6_9CHLO|nr:hypothetical protein A3770_03p23510 [Chloropicon primus]UPQ99043.1 hypothetical protein HOP50_03g23490 [Chloropicon primus]|eukprot:QDZ19833.1 hypothetical protein A3770_03p23510 [Chloropicon primus]
MAKTTEEGRLSEAWLDRGTLGVPVHLKSRGRYWGCSGDRVAFDKKGACCDEKFVLSTDVEKGVHVLKTEDGRCCSFRPGGPIELVKHDEMLGYESVRSLGGARLAGASLEVRGEVCIGSASWGGLLEPLDKGLVAFRGEGGGSASARKWNLVHRGNSIFTITLVQKPSAARRGVRRQKREQVLFVGKGNEVGITSEDSHVFPSRASLFQVKPRVVGGVLCFTIEHQRGRLSASPTGSLRVAPSLGGWRKPGTSEHFVLFSAESSSGGMKPAPLQNLCARMVDDEELLELIGLGRQGREHQEGAKGGVPGDFQCCATCGDVVCPLEPETNPNHYRYLEVQLRRLNGGTTTGRNVRAGQLVKVMGTLLAFTRLRSFFLTHM